MKEYCVDLKIAKELKEKGFPQNTEFRWCKKCDSNKKQHLIQDWNCCIPDKDWYFAPISDEILKELPKEIYFKEYEMFGLNISTDYENYLVSYDLDYSYIAFSDKKLSNSLAKMWLYLKKERHIK